ncbi:MAG: CBS domain-containing protein, partial [Thermodesulfovibrionia bacterium]|nr:CBS domain-containing protein [Thermodesulfovibrionia bacterium]
MLNIAKYLMLVRCTQYRSKMVSVSLEETGRTIANKLITTRLPGVPVVDSRNKKVVGIVTEFDILSALRGGMDLDKLTAENIMSGAPETADIETSVEDLIEMMIKNNSTMVPITKNDKLAGIIDRCSIMEGYMAPGADRYLA